MPVCILPGTVTDAGSQPKEQTVSVDNPSTERKNKARQKSMLDVCGPGILEL